jgi:hypothetical protein
MDDDQGEETRFMSRKMAGLGVLFLLPSAWGQLAISARSGMIHYVEGQVELQGDPVKLKFGSFPEVGEGQMLETTDGRAEVLLTPGVFLRLAERTSFRMLSNKLTDTRVEVVTGTALVEVEELPKDNQVTVQVGEAQTGLRKKGLYRFDANASELRVFDGQAQVTLGDESITVKSGRQVIFGSPLAATKFNSKDKEKEELYAWSARRSAMIAQANLYSAQAANSSGFRMSSNSWAWNPAFGMYTFLPVSGFALSPFGWSFYSPSIIRWVFVPRYSQSAAYGTRSNGPGGGSSSPRFSGLAQPSAAPASGPAFSGGRSGGGAAPSAAPRGGGRGR